MAIPDAGLKLLGEMVLYGGGAAAVAYLIFQFLGKRWIENKFQERLDLLKHQHALELQRLRVEIDSLLSAKLKLQEREFNLLPEAWHKLDEAYGQVSSLVSPFQQYPDLDRATSIQLEELLDSTEFSASQKQEIRDARNRGEMYRQLEFRYRLSKVKQKVSELHNFVIRNGIFFPAPLKEKLNQVSETLWSAITSKEVGVDAKDHKLQREGWEEIQRKSKPLYEAIESEIRARLESHGIRK